MSRVVYCRMVGYIVTILLHVGNIGVLLSQRMTRKQPVDERLKQFSELQARYLTCWTFFLQIVHALVGLLCDLLTLKNSSTKNYKLPKYLKGFRDTLFAAVVFPTSFVVFTLFWPLFIYDRSLVFPVFLDKILTPLSNHIMHTAIVPIVLWEAVLQNRTTPKSHIRYLAHLVFHLALYLAVLIYTYVERGIWIYPIATKLWGTIYFPFLLILVLTVAVISYFIQWYIPSFGSKVPEKSKKKVR